MPVRNHWIHTSNYITIIQKSNTDFFFSVSTHWTIMSHKLTKEKLSLSKPVYGPFLRRIFPFVNWATAFGLFLSTMEKQYLKVYPLQFWKASPYFFIVHVILTTWLITCQARNNNLDYIVTHICMTAKKSKLLIFGRLTPLFANVNEGQNVVFMAH